MICPSGPTLLLFYLKLLFKLFPFFQTYPDTTESCINLFNRAASHSHNTRELSVVSLVSQRRLLKGNTSLYSQSILVKSIPF